MTTIRSSLFLFLAGVLSAQLKITTGDLPTGAVGTAYSATMAASGGTSPYTWAITSGTLPTGITMNSSGIFSGTPTVAAWSDFFTVQVTDNVAATATLRYTIIVTPAIDTYGGDLSKSCTVTGFFHTQKIGNRWWYCTPLGHLSMILGAAAISADTCTGTGACVDGTTGIVNNSGTISTAHYGDTTTNWGCAQIKRMVAWGMNTVGQQSAASTNPVTNSCSPKLPAISQVQMISAANNLNNYWGTNGAVKDIVQGVGPNFTGYRAPDMDVFDPNLTVGFHTLTGALGYPATWNSPWILGTLGDDIDWLYAFAAGPDFPTVPPGNTSPHAGWLTAITSPLQTYNGNARGTQQIYANAQLYAKTLSASPPGSCTFSAPCSWPDFVRNKYGNIGAANTAWGSAYTSLGTTGTTVTETVGTGDGATTNFNFTLAHHPLSPMSVQVKVAGTLKGGDCAWWNCTEPANTGEFHSPDGTLVSGSACNVAGPTLTTQGAPYPAASYFTACIYTYNDGSFGIVGLFQSIHANAGQRPTWTSPAGAGNITGWKSYGFCINDSGGAAFGCDAAGTPTANHPFYLQASGLTIGVNWDLPNTGMLTSSPAPSPPGLIHYDSGVGNLVFASAPALGQAIMVTYTYGGWKSGGTGLMDEDGGIFSGVGTNFYCLATSALATNVCKGAASPHDYPVPNANAAWGADVDAWLGHYSAQAHKIIRNEISATNPLSAFLGFDTEGAWGVPERQQVLQGASQYVDAIYPAWAPPAQDVGGCCAQKTYDYMDLYLGKPMFTATFIAATPDSFLYPFYGNSASDKGTQELKGQFYSGAMSTLFNMISAQGSFTWLGAVGWGWTDFWTDGGGSTTRTNWGLVSLNDNPYNGKEDCSVTRTDPLGFTTTAEANIPVWQASHAYAVDTANGVYPTVQPTSGTLYLFRQLSGSGTSGGSQPTWCTTTGCTTTDGSVTWTNLGPKSSAVCFGNAVDYVKQGNALWFNLSNQGGGGGVGGKATISGTVVVQ